MRGKTLDCKGPRDTHNLLILIWLVVQSFLIGVTSNRCVNSFIGHTFMNIWVVRNRLKSDMWDFLVDEPIADGTLCRRLGGHSIAKSPDRCLSTFRRVGEDIVGQLGYHETLSRKC